MDGRLVMDKLIAQLVDEGMVKDHTDAAEVVTLYCERVLGMSRYETKLRLLLDTVATLKTKLTVH